MKIRDNSPGDPLPAIERQDMSFQTPFGFTLGDFMSPDAENSDRAKIRALLRKVDAQARETGYRVRANVPEGTPGTIPVGQALIDAYNALFNPLRSGGETLGTARLRLPPTPGVHVRNRAPAATEPTPSAEPQPAPSAEPQPDAAPTAEELAQQAIEIIRQGAATGEIYRTAPGQWQMKPGLRKKLEKLGFGNWHPSQLPAMQGDMPWALAKPGLFRSLKILKQVFTPPGTQKLYPQLGQADNIQEFLAANPEYAQLKPAQWKALRQFLKATTGSKSGR